MNTELTVNDYLDNLELDRQDMINSLKSKGMEISDNATFTEIVPKIDGLVDINGYYDLTKQSSGDIKSYIKQIPMIDTSGYTNMANMFQEYKSLITIPLLDTSNVKNMYYMFQGCTSLSTIPQLDTSNVTNMGYMFYACTSLTTIPQLVTNNVTTFQNMFLYCKKLKNVPELNAGKVNEISGCFSGCHELENFGGLKDLGKAYDTTKSANYSYYTLSLINSTKLTHDSLMNIINNLYDIATKGCQPQQLVLGSTNLAKLTEEEIAIATNKGWTVS